MGFKLMPDRYQLITSQRCCAMPPSHVKQNEKRLTDILLDEVIA